MDKIIGFKKEGYLSVDDAFCEQIIINLDDRKEKIRICGFRRNCLKTWSFRILNIIFLGFPWLITRWYPDLIVLCYSKCSLKSAEYIRLLDAAGMGYMYNVQEEKVPQIQSRLKIFSEIGNVVRFFYHNERKFVLNVLKGGFVPLRGWDGGETTVKQVMEDSHGLTESEQSVLRKYYGENLILIEIKSYWDAFWAEVVHPFYLFQLFSVLLWMFDEYEFYAACVFTITACSIGVTLRTNRNVSLVLVLAMSTKQQLQLKELVKYIHADDVGVLRRDTGQIQQINPSLLVPGDIIEIPPQGCIMKCDAVLLNGICIVNESSLTGESSACTKTPLTSSEEIFDSYLYKRNTLYCGSEVLQTRYYGDHKVLAVVVNTGFCTARGELIRGILHPKPLGFQFYEDSVRFIALLFGLAVVGIGYLLFIEVPRDIDSQTILFDSLDIITIVVPPALPAAMTSGVFNAQKRLQKYDIFCANPARINVAGKLKLFCFDKTGTLTEEGLDLFTVMPVDQVSKEMISTKPTYIDCKSHFVVSMATCHSLTKVGGNLVGDPLDLAIFNSLRWELIESGPDHDRYDTLFPTVVRPRKSRKSSHVSKRSLSSANSSINETQFNDGVPYEIGIVRQFLFSSSVQSMSVITRCLDSNHFVIYTKGAPEKVIGLCNPSSVPASIDNELKKLTSSGYRVLALAYRELKPAFNWRKVQKMRRDEVEKDLNLLGLVVLKNNLRPDSASVIHDLKAANIRSIMITGDNLLTAVSVSRECGMVMPDDLVVNVFVETSTSATGPPALRYEPIGVTNEYPLPPVTDKRWHYALDGPNFALLRSHCPELLPNIILRGKVFARMLPEQKMQLIEALQDIHFIVGMCGDGANDCGALKAAHVGIAISEGMNAVAAPFTCTSRDLTSVIYLIREGRCALVATFIIFKYMIIYSLIQFVTVLILHTRGVSMGTTEFLFLDLFVTTSLAVVVGRTGPTEKLHSTSPLAKLFSISTLLSLIIHSLIIFGVQMMAIYVLTLQKWYVPQQITKSETTITWDNNVLYSVSCFQYLIFAVIFRKGKPHCQPFFTDFWFMATIISLTWFMTILTAIPISPLSEWFELVPIDSDTKEQTSFRALILLFPLANLVISVFIEFTLSHWKWLRNWSYRKLDSPTTADYIKIGNDKPNLSDSYETP